MGNRWLIMLGTWLTTGGRGADDPGALKIAPLFYCPSPIGPFHWGMYLTPIRP